MNNEKVIEINCGFDLKVEGIEICGPDCENFEPETYKLFCRQLDSGVGKTLYNEMRKYTNMPKCLEPIFKSEGA